MSITIQQSPAATTYFPAGNPIEILATSTNTAQPNFKIKYRLWYGTGVPTLIATGNTDVLPNTTQVLIDVGKLCHSKMNINIDNLKSGIHSLKNETFQLHPFTVTLQEYYGSTPTDQGTAVSGNLFYVQNAHFKYSSFVNNDHNLYRIDSAAGSDQLTKRLCTAFNNYVAATHSAVVAAPQNYFNGQYPLVKITSTQLMQLLFLWQGTSGTSKIVTIYFHGATFTPALFSGSISLSSNTCPTSLNIGMAAIIATSEGTLGSLNSTGKYMSLTVRNTTYQLAATYLYEIDWSYCSRYDKFEIHWLNRFSGFDSFIFDKRSRKFTDIERRQYITNTNVVSGSSIVRASSDRIGRTFHSNTKERWEVNSRNLKEWELEGLEDLLSSPVVYWNDAGTFRAIMITNPMVHEHKKNLRDKIFNVSFEFTIDNGDSRW